MTLHRFNAARAILLAALSCLYVAETSRLRAAETTAVDPTAQIAREVALGMRKADHTLVAAVNTALERMLADGIVNRICASYGIDQRPPTIR
jgi:ABC-type amino acid transport substrate-binding protein